VNIPFIDESSRADGYRQGGIRSYEVVEAGIATASKTKIGTVALSVSKEEIYVPVTDEMLSDSPVTMGALLPTMAAREFGFRFDDKCINGVGAGEPMGILNAPCVVSVAKETGQAATSIVTENVIKMWARLWNGSRANAVWFINQDCLPALQTMYVGLGMAGLATYMPPGGISGAPYGTLIGRPVIEIEQCQTLGTVGDIILADMSQYLWAEKSEGMQSAQSMHIRFDYGETVFRFTVRRDGRPWWRSTLTPANGSNTVAPFVTLAVRA
jgi:HK97 family phage major capsid protein